MGGAKRDMEEKEAALARRDQYLIDVKGYQRCVECQELFIPKHEEIVCEECFAEKMRED
jgi:hypothetical protein